MEQPAYEYRHVVSLEETNALGNVYFAHYLRWQGKCREQFLFDHAPSVVRELSETLCLVTMKCSCEYFAELAAGDRLLIRMRPRDHVFNRLTLTFEYWRVGTAAAETEPLLAARGEQQLGWLERDGEEFSPRAVPDDLLAAIDAAVAAQAR
ncbi:acyl-CoA thioesterase [Pseudonocardia zijingensis]|jgi:enediyne biosynthesis thioesterase|uniref:Enediyne biosynthesis thioesterase n=1 Tax=Pseudonocardia zijingensis TaxID=153376 RepID=A0ABP3YQC7_9PSEU